jgi:MFS family permease
MVRTRRVLRVIRLLALVGFVLSALLMPLGLGGAALGLGLGLIFFGIAGVVLGGALAVLATRVLSDHVELRGSRRTLLAASLAVAGVESLLSVVSGGFWLFLVGLSSAFLVGLSSAFAAGFAAAAVTSRKRGESVLARILALSMLALGALVLWGQFTQTDFDARRAARIALLPVSSDLAREDAEAVAPDGWAVPTLKVRATYSGPFLMAVRTVLMGAGGTEIGASRSLPDRLVGPPLRGIIVVDCAGSEQLEVVARGFDAPAVLGTSPCRPEPQIVTIAIPDSVMQRDQTSVFLWYIAVDPIDEGPTGGVNRALLLVALAGTPDPESDALRATFVAAFGTEEPR